ncbi:MAG: hypothetical protein QNJ97_10865 [Myxococcota bacterium]|nr:hypothetical protein [Myxococcota bacterium]
MQYLLIYLAIGAGVAILMAYWQARHRPNQLRRSKLGILLGAYLFIALAWPVSVAAFFYGAFSQLLEGTQETDQT